MMNGHPMQINFMWWINMYINLPFDLNIVMISAYTFVYLSTHNVLFVFCCCCNNIATSKYLPYRNIRSPNTYTFTSTRRDQTRNVHFYPARPNTSWRCSLRMMYSIGCCRFYNTQMSIVARYSTMQESFTWTHLQNDLPNNIKQQKRRT